MKIALYNRVYEPTDLPFFKHLFKTLLKYNFSIVIFKDFYDRLQGNIDFNFNPEFFTDHKDLNDGVDFMLSLGGDGTMLDTVCYVNRWMIPTLGVNLGRLGFLADVSEEEIEMAIKSLVAGSYGLETRSLIHLDSSINLFNDYPFALNEFTIHRKDSSSMIKIHTFLNGDFLNTYWADGLIIATPTGSTGYSLSCNGPVIFPTASNFLITPVAPHNLNIRPIVVPDDTVLSFEVEGRTDQFLCTLDSRVATITKEIQLAVKKETFGLNLIRLDEHNFVNTIRKKLYWGVDNRN